ncbi:hypothetical protein Tco_0343183, partial [Tanacetum coccineum]
LDMKSTTGGCQFLGKRLISWQCKKQTIVANSTTEAEYVAAANCCGQVLWIQNQMLDYGFNFMNTKIHIDNESIIFIVKNPVFHFKTKRIEIRHHFIKDSYEKKLIQVIKIHTDQNVADLLTKAFDVSRKAKRTTEISQSSGPIHLDTDETVDKEWEDIMERAATTASNLEAEQDSGSGPRCQDTILGGAEAQIRFEAASKQSNDPPLSRVNTLRSGEDNMKLKELMELYTKLSERILDNKNIKSDLDSAPTDPTTKETTLEEHVSTLSYDPPPSGKDRMQLAELMSLCTNLQEKVLDLEKAKTDQANEITSLKKRVKQLEKRRKSRTLGLRRLRKVGSSSRVESSNDARLGAQEDASKHGRKIKDLDADAKVTLVNETQEINDDTLMFDTGVLEEQEIEFEKVVEEPVVIVATTTKSILHVTTAATTVRPRAKGIIFHDQEEQPEVHLKKKDQVALDEEMARNLEAQLQAELIEEERLARKKEEEANIALIES